MAHPNFDRNAVTLDQFYRLAGGLGILLIVVAGADNLLTWLPTEFGNREWEFGTVTASFNGLLSITLGVGLTQVWLSTLEQAWPLRLLGAIQVLLALCILGAALLFSRNISIALSAASASGVGTGLMKAVVKASFQGVVYPVAYLLLAWTSFKWARQIARAGDGTSKGAQRAGIVTRA